MRHAIIGISALVCLAMASVADGAIESLTAVGQGFYYSGGGGMGRNLNFIPTGHSDTTLATVYSSRNWFAFDLSGIDPDFPIIVSATLLVDIHRYASADATETLELHQIATTPGVLGTANSVAYYNDLGDGLAYGSRAFSQSDETFLRPIALNWYAINDMNQGRLDASGKRIFEIGGLLASGEGTASQYLFASEAGWVTQRPILQITTATPEPATVIIWSLLGALGIAVGVYRRRKAA